MAKKTRKVRTFARTASKSMEKNLVENAKKLKDDPYLVIPNYTDIFSKKCFKKIRKNLDKISRFKDDVSKLEKLSNRKSLGGAVAGTLLVAHSEKAPYLAVAKFPTGEITYAQRGKADKEKLIAAQHFNDPLLRLLGIKDIVLKGNIHVYSWDKDFISTGLEANPPEDFINFVMKKTGFSYKNGVAACSHIKTESAKKKQVLDKQYLRIHWTSADTIVAVCKDCAKSTKNTLFDLTKYLIESDISNDFSIDVIGQLVKESNSVFDNETQYVDEYLSGKLTDISLIRKNMQKREESIKQSGEKLLILDGTSYGTDVDGFIKALKPNKFEEKGLELVLTQVEGAIVLDNVTPNKVLENFWEEHGLDAINSIIDDEELAEKFFSLDDTPSDILEVVFEYRKRQDVLSQLPRYKSLPPLASFADHIARTYKTFGEKKSLAELNKRPDDHKAKSLAYSFLLVFGKGKDKKWQYTAVEVESGEFLKEYAKKFLDSKPKKYHKALQELIAASGSSEKIDSNLL